MGVQTWFDVQPTRTATPYATSLTLFSEASYTTNWWLGLAMVRTGAKVKVALICWKRLPSKGLGSQIP